MTPMVKHAVKILSVAIDPVEYSFFDMSGGEFGRTQADPKYLYTHRPPFEKNVVVWRGQTPNHEAYELIMMVIGQDLDEGVVCTAWKGRAGTKLRDLPSMVYVKIDGQIKYGALEESDELPRDVAEIMLATVSKWLEHLDTGCKSYRAEVRNTFTNRRKISEGKRPLYEWRTVFIKASATRQESKGGTHASPRQHDRRGHIRRLNSGKNVWVKACKVGDSSKGAVFHDYQITG